MRAIATLITTLALIAPASAATELAPMAAMRADLVPPGWEIEAEAKGDLDSDGREDLALVLQNADAAPEIGLPVPRMLVVAFGADAGYDRVIENERFILCIADPGLNDCFDASSGGLRIQNGQLIVGLDFFAWSGNWEMWSKTYIFDWHPGGFELSRFDWYQVNRASGETTQTVANFASHIQDVYKGNIATDAQTKTQTVLAPTPPIMLGDVEDGLQFNPLTAE